MRILVDDIRIRCMLGLLPGHGVRTNDLRDKYMLDTMYPHRQFSPVPLSLPNTIFVPASWSRAKIEGLLLIVLLMTALWSMKVIILLSSGFERRGN